MFFRLFLYNNQDKEACKKRSKKKKSRKPKEVFCFSNYCLLDSLFVCFISQNRAYKIHLNE